MKRTIEAVQCVFEEEGETLQALLLRCFRLYAERILAEHQGQPPL